MLKSFFMTLLLTVGLTGVAQAIEVHHPKAVVEVFTSQGCHSCPPADKFVGKLAGEGNVLALGWHVDYWDYLGWKDTFASKDNTERQRRYARALREQQVYTPQAIINGRTHTTGSREQEIRKIINYFEKDKMGMMVPVNVSVADGESLKVSVESHEAASQATLYIVFYDSKSTVDIARGENGGKQLTYHNVVREIQPVGMVKADGLLMNYPLAEMKRGGYDTCAFILQKTVRNGDPGPIVGAAVVSGL